MPRISVLSFATLSIFLSACGQPQPLGSPEHVLGKVVGDAESRVIVDSARREVILYAGPFRIPAEPKMEGMGHTHDMASMSAHDMANMPGMKAPAGATADSGKPVVSSGMDDHGMHFLSPLVPFNWPMDAWYRGFKASVVSADGTELPRTLLHHLTGVDFAHRQLLEPDLIRFVGVGSETQDIVLPRFLGVPMKAGQSLAVYAGWHNDSGKDIEGVYIRLELLYVPSNVLIKPIAVFPVQMDVFNTPGEPNAFALPPGHSDRGYQFDMPINGRFLALGGHLHDFGVDIRLEDPQSGKELARVASVRDSTGRVLSVGIKYFMVRGIRVTAGHKYAVSGRYDSPNRDTVANAAMVIMAGLFAPKDPAQWPRPDFNDPQTKADLSSLPGGSHVSAPVIGAMAAPKSK